MAEKKITYLDKPRVLKCDLPTLRRISKITGTDIIGGPKHWAQGCTIENVHLVAQEMLKHEDPEVNAEAIIDPTVLQDLVTDMIEVSSPRAVPTTESTMSSGLSVVSTSGSLQ
jgi:hypothetical protein